uniref:synaptogyrin-2-like n=1 Tax=Myxine glutinosa TaxID=7769 RepID=UPI00358F0ABA
MEGAFGAGRSGTEFSLKGFFSQPRTIVRLLCLLFALITSGCLIDEGYVNSPGRTTLKCVFNDNASTCHYGLAVGIIAILVAFVFLIVDTRFPQLSSVQERKYFVLGDLMLAGALSFLWFIGFCVLTNQWSKTYNVTALKIVVSSAQAVIAFSFFSIISWCVQTALAWQRYQLGAHFGDEYTDPSGEGPQVPGSSYQQSYAEKPGPEQRNDIPQNY